jgi:hypothetical protein
MDEREPDLVPNDTDRRAFLRRMVAAGFAVPAVATLESMLAADAEAHGLLGHLLGHGHGHCGTTTPAPTTTAAPSTTIAPTTTPAPTTTAAPATTVPPATTTTISAP